MRIKELTKIRILKYVFNENILDMLNHIVNMINTNKSNCATTDSSLYESFPQQKSRTLILTKPHDPQSTDVLEYSIYKHNE